MEIDHYAHLSSPLHTWDPRFKLASGFLLLFVCASVTAPLTLIIAGATATFLILLSRLPIRFVLRTLRTPLLLLALMMPFLIFTSGRRVIWSYSFISIYREGLLTAGRISIKAFTIMLLFMALFGTAPLPLSLKALEHLKVPSTLLAIMLFTYRYIYLYVDELHKLLTAARLRGYNLLSAIRHILVSSRIMVTLLLRSYEQSERVAAAMRLRGFNGSFPVLNNFNYRSTDMLLSVATVAITGTMMWLQLR